MQGPWYQETEMCRINARDEMFKLLKDDYIDENKLRFYIKNVIKDDTSMCSVMGYYVLGQRDEFKKQIIKEYTDS